MKKTVTLLMTLIGAVLMATTAFAAKGSLVMVGGALEGSNADIYNKFIELAGGKDSAKIGIIGAASGKPVRNSNRFKKNLMKYGVAEANISILPIAVKNDSGTKEVDESEWVKNADKAEVADSIKSFTGIWFIGGDQMRINQVMFREDGSETATLKAMRTLYENGAVIGGTSAGAAVMSDIMIASGDSIGTLKGGIASSYGSMDEQEYGPAFITKGLGFFKYGTVDQHFDRKARYGRLIVISYENKDTTPIGFGIEENTAMVVYNGTQTAEVLGAGGVTIIDVSKAQKDEKSKMTSMKDIRVSFIQTGDQFNLETMSYINHSKKYKTHGGDEYMNVKDPIVTGVFSRNALLKHFISYDLVDNKAASEIISYSFDKEGTGFQLTFRKTEATEGYWKALDGAKDNYSAINVALDITPVKVSISPL